MKFRLWTVLYVFALLAAALATFRFSRSDSAAACRDCQLNLRVLALGVLNHDSAQGRFPAAQSADNTGQTLHSWRTAVLPYSDPAKSSSSYLLKFWRSMALQQPWDSPANQPKTDTVLDHYQCPLHRDRNSPHTNYFAVVDPSTAWPPGRGRRIAEVSDGTVNTILLIEVPNRSTPWGKPEDLTLEEAVELLTSDPKDIGATHPAVYSFFRYSRPGINVVFCDGHAETLPLPLSKEDALAYLTAAGGELVQYAGNLKSQPGELNYRRVYSAALLALLILAPLIWISVGKCRSPVFANPTPEA